MNFLIILCILLEFNCFSVTVVRIFLNYEKSVRKDINIFKNAMLKEKFNELNKIINSKYIVII